MKVWRYFIDHFEGFVYLGLIFLMIFLAGWTVGFFEALHIIDVCGSGGCL